MKRILVIDDDKDITALLQRFLTKNGYEVQIAWSGNEGMEKLADFKPDLVMTDYRLDDMNGAELLTKIKDINIQIPVLIITGYSDLKTAVNVIRLGAADYITKPLLPEEILLTIKQALSKAENGEAETTVDNNTAIPKKKPQNGGYYFNESPESGNLLRQIELVAPTNYSVIIYGESGSGKEGVAKAIHDRSKRAGKPFVTMDCGAISKELAGSELFGHEKGSFTGAVGQKIGHFELANGGTLFLDEIANLPYDVQVSLLRVVQEKKVRRVGGTKEFNIDVRIIVASNERLSEASRKGKFREDLYHRFNEFSIEVPPLRERKNDIMFFAHRFLQETAGELGKKIIGFNPDVQEAFLKYPWFGNLRELKNVIKRSALLTVNDKVDIRALPFEIVNYNQLEFGDSLSAPVEQLSAQLPVSEPLYPAAGVSGFEKKSEAPKVNLKKAAQHAEYEMILEALKKSNFNKSKAAELLGIDRKTLYNKMKQINLE
ncbi:MAG: sigma-54 dependent transcriptional regulator [Chitinophagales bacterium]